MEHAALRPASRAAPVARRPRPLRGPVLTALAASVLAAPLCGDLLAQRPDPEDRTATLRGRVVDHETGRPIPEAAVSVERLDWGFMADSLGRFNLPDVPLGPAYMVVERLGYGTTRIPIDVRPDHPPLELRLTADPVILEGFEIVMDRFQRRRRSTPTSVRSFDQVDLRTSGAWDAVDFVRRHSFLSQVSCPPDAFQTRCMLHRGRPVAVSVFIDEMPAAGGLDQLAMYHPGEFYMIEIYGGGRHVRAYTHQFMERAARIRLSPVPLFF